jgi:hypothetical protein
MSITALQPPPALWRFWRTPNGHVLAVASEHGH